MRVENLKGLFYFPQNLIFYPLFFPLWWYFYNLSFWARFLVRSVLLLADALGIAQVIRHFFAPYRQDRTWVGYFIGIVVRVFYLAGAVGVLLGGLGVLGILFLTYLLAPVLIVYWLSQPADSLHGFLLFAFCFLLYFLVFIKQPKFESDFTPVAANLWSRLEKVPYSPALFLKRVRNDKKVRRIFRRLDLKIEDLIGRLEQVSVAGSKQVGGKKSRAFGTSSKLDFEQSSTWRDVLMRARRLRVEWRHKFVDVDLLLGALILVDEKVQKALRELETRYEEVLAAIYWVEGVERRRASWKFWRDENFHLYGGAERAWVAGFLPNIKHFSRDITKMVAEGRAPPVYGREKEIESVAAILNRTTRNNVLLVGPPGVGKASIIYAVAQRMLSGKLSGKLTGKKLLALDIGGMLAGAARPGDLQARIRDALSETKAGGAILFIDGIQDLLKAGFEYFMPAISAGEIQLIGTITPSDYKKYVESRAAFAAQFERVIVGEPGDQELLPILEAVAAQIEAEKKVQITIPAIQEAVELSRRYVHDQVLPEKAVALLDEAAVRKGGGKPAKVTKEDIARLLAEKTGLPVDKITQSEKEKLMHLEELIHRRIVGQEEAVKVVAQAMRRARAGLAGQYRPVASFLFVGPTGVGKTETAKYLSLAYFGSVENMIRIDMSEYSEAHSVNRLIGAPPGMAGFEQGGQLTEAVRQNPFTIVLLDEVEKAHPEVLNLLLQVLEDGRLTDGQGRTADFTNTLIIATSNAFANLIYERLGAADHDLEAIYQEVKVEIETRLQQVFPPELLNRFDAVVIFRPLSPEEVVKIARILLDEVTGEMAKQEIQVSFSEDLVEKVAKLGFDPKFGARPLRRVIQDKVEDYLSEKILKNELKAGGSIFLSARDLGL